MTRLPQSRPRPGGRRWVAYGMAAAALYLGAVTLAWPYPVRLLYDGLAPLPPYRWVHPPPGRARDNQPPQSGAGTVPLGPPSRAVEVSTDDDQALVTLPQGAIAPRSGESSAKVTVVPLDPATVAPAPSGRRFDGNAYRFEARYAVSGEPAVLTAPVTIVLRYPVHATLMIRSGESSWTVLGAQAFTGSQQVLANTDRLGVFAAAASSSGGVFPRPGAGGVSLGVGLAAGWPAR